MEIVFLLPTVFVLVLIAVYRIHRKMEQEVDWEKNKDKYKYKGYRY